MDKILKPKTLEVDPSDTAAEKKWKHWKLTFENFLANCKVDTQELSDPQKLAVLFNSVSTDIFNSISKSDKYDTAIKTLEDMFVKPKNEVFARHCLVSRKQQEGETVAQFMKALDILSRDCTFVAVNAQQYNDEYVRDVFIRGLRSNDVRQRLLEEKCNRADAFDKARTLELSLKTSRLIQDNRSDTVKR